MSTRRYYRAGNALPRRSDHDDPRTERGPEASEPPEPSDHRRRWTLGGVPPAHASGVSPYRWGHGGRGPGHGERAHSELAEHVGGRAPAPPDWPGGILVPADEEHARSRDRHDAAPPVRAARRSRPRFLRCVSDGGARVLPSATGEASAGGPPGRPRVPPRALSPPRRPRAPGPPPPRRAAGTR